MLYTRKGDGGTTKAFDTPPGQRISKASCRTEALGTLDELNSLLGFCRARVAEAPLRVGGKGPLFRDIIRQVQKDLFIVQAEVAGAPKTIPAEKVRWMEKIIDAAERELPPIKYFVVPGGSEVSAIFDMARTVARRTERSVIVALEKGEASAGDGTKSYLNRLSSLLYALARLANKKLEVREESPSYE